MTAVRRTNAMVYRRGARRSPDPLGPGFRALFVGSLVTNMGDGIRLAALPLLAAEVTSSPLLISTVAAAQFLPWLTFAPVGGALVDRRERRSTILTTQACRGIVMAVLAALVLADIVAIWQLCVVAFVITAGEILVDPSIVALVPTVVADDDLDVANGRIGSAEIITNDVVGAPVGAMIFGFAPWLPFVLDAVSYLGSIAPFARLPSPAADRPVRDASSSRSIRSEAREGFDWLRTHPLLGPFTGTMVIYYLGLSSAISLLVVLVKIEIGASNVVFGIVLAAGASGAAIGALLGGRVAALLGRRATLSAGVGVQAITLASMAAVDSTWQLVVLWVVNGVPLGLQRPVARAVQQRLTPNHLLGRVNVTARIFTRGVMVVGALVGGTTASAVGVRWSFAVGGAIEAVAAMLMWRVLAPLSRNAQPR